MDPPVLVVDPDPAVAALIRGRIDGFQVIQVSDPGELARQVDLQHPRTVIYNLPPGEDTSANIVPLNEAISAPVPRILCSVPSQAWLADHLDVASCLTKPVTQIPSPRPAKPGLVNTLLNMFCVN